MSEWRLHLSTTVPLMSGRLELRSASDTSAADTISIFRAGRGEGGSASVAEWNGMGVKRQTGKTQALLANVSE